MSKLEKRDLWALIVPIVGIGGPMAVYWMLAVLPHFLHWLFSQR